MNGKNRIDKAGAKAPADYKEEKAMTVEFFTDYGVETAQVVEWKKLPKKVKYRFSDKDTDGVEWDVYEDNEYNLYATHIKR